MKMKKVFILTMVTILMMGMGTTSYGADTAYSSGSLGGTRVNYITVNINSPAIKPVILQANNQLTSTATLSTMANNSGVVAAINGTYFEAYGGLPVPWGVIIKDGKLLHAGGGAVFGITRDNKFLVDNLSFQFESYADGKLANTIWRINHPSIEPDAITVFTSEYGKVTVPAGGKVVVVKSGIITELATTDVTAPADGYAILFNPSAVQFMYDRYAIGMAAYYKAEIIPKRTNAEDWNNVIVGLGAGPSLIINGEVTADGASEGFFESKINVDRAGRSFIGANKEGKIIMGSIGSANLKEAASICQYLGLVNAMCLDGGGSISLYYKPNGIAQNGRAINNGLGFISTESRSIPQTQPQNMAKPTAATVLVDGKAVDFEAYNIEGNNYFKLRDLAMALNGSEKNFAVGYDQGKNAINLLSRSAYTPVGGELTRGSSKDNPNGKTYKATNSVLYLDGLSIKMTAYNIENNNYFKLRDMGKCINFGVGYDNNTKTITIDTKAEYAE